MKTQYPHLTETLLAMLACTCVNVGVMVAQTATQKCSTQPLMTRPSTPGIDMEVWAHALVAKCRDEGYEKALGISLEHSTNQFGRVKVRDGKNKFSPVHFQDLQTTKRLGGVLKLIKLTSDVDQKLKLLQIWFNDTSIQSRIILSRHLFDFKKLQDAKDSSSPKICKVILQLLDSHQDYRDELIERLLKIVDGNQKPTLDIEYEVIDGADASEEDLSMRGQTPLIMSICHVDDLLVNMILLAKTCPNYRGKTEAPPLIHAFTVYKVLQESKASSDEQESALAIVKHLLNHPNLDLNNADSLGLTPMLFASRYGLHELVKLTLEVGKTRNELQSLLETTVTDLEGLYGNPEGSVHGHTPLLLAIRFGHVEVVETLLKYFADPNNPGKQEVSDSVRSLPLSTAARHVWLAKAMERDDSHTQANVATTILNILLDDTRIHYAPDGFTGESPLHTAPILGLDDMVEKCVSKWPELKKEVQSFPKTKTTPLTYLERYLQDTNSRT